MEMNKQTVKLWLDDVLPPPENTFTWVTTVPDALGILISENVTHISFDHDLGDGLKTGYDLAELIEKIAYRMAKNPKYSPSIEPVTWDVHSNNFPGRVRINQAMTSASGYWEIYKSKKKI